MKISHYMSSLGSRETASKEPESEEHELKRVEHETGGGFEPEGATSEELELEKTFLPEPDADESGEDSSDDESEQEPDQGGLSGAHHKVPATVRKLYDSFTGAPQPITQSHTSSGRERQSFTTGADHTP